MVREYRMKEKSESKREMNRIIRRFQPRFQRQISTFPEGEYVIITRCFKEDKRTGVEEPFVRIVGQGDLLEGVESCRDDILNYAKEPEDPVEVQNKKQAKAAKYLDMPVSALARSKKLRKMLRKLWKLEGHSKTKQIYSAVQKGETGFSWWADVFPTIPFTNVAVEAADASKRIYDVVAPKLYEAMTGKQHDRGNENDVVEPIEDDPLDDIVQCVRREMCTRPNGHVGACNRRHEIALLPVIMEEEEPMEEQPSGGPGEGSGEISIQQQCVRKEMCTRPNGHVGACNRRREMVVDVPIVVAVPESQPFDRKAFYAMVKEKVHKDDPFPKFSAGEIAQFKAHVDGGMGRADAYMALGKSLKQDYSLWARRAEGVRAWQDVVDAFPRYLDVLSVAEVSAPPRKEPKKKVKQKRKRTVQDSEIVKRKNQSKKRHSKAARTQAMRHQYHGYV